VGNHWIFSGAGSYSHTASNFYYGAAHVIGGSGQASYQLTTKMQFFAQYSFISQTYSFGSTERSTGFTRNQFGGGIRFNLGNAITHGGVQ
jgi:hypothetical protein